MTDVLASWAEWLGRAFAVLAIAGAIYTVLATVFVRRFFHHDAQLTPPAIDPSTSVTIMKALHEGEPALRHNLQSFFCQAREGQADIVFGVQDTADPAIHVVEALRVQHPDLKVQLRIDGERRGRNAKVSNLIGMAGQARGDVLVISDSDIEAPPEYLARVLDALAAPGVGVVTCPYVGRGDTGFWSDVAAMGLSWQFMPNVITGVGLGMARPCMGSTVALRRETLERIGGFQRFRDVLADDYLLGAAVRERGLRSVVAPVLVSHSCSEMTLGEVLSHELRWARTVKSVDFPGHLGSLVTYPTPLALVAVLLLNLSPASLAILVAALAARVLLATTVDRIAHRRTGAAWLLPIRDMLSFAVFVGSFFGHTVVWRGQRFHVTTNGALAPQRP